MAGPLDGVRVLDFGRWMTAPACARILADLGADVIKVEARGSPDPLRGMVELTAATYTNGDMSKAAVIPNSTFDITNRGKRSIALDLTKVEGRDIAYKLVGKADVLVHNWRQKAAKRLGMEFETLVKYNPRLIYGSVSAWGPEGPDADEPAMDAAASARAGMMYQWGGPEMPPLLHMGGIADQSTAIAMVEAILAALFARERTGIGQKIDASLLGSMVALGATHIQAQLIRGFTITRRDRVKTSNPLATYYRCSDDKWILLSMYKADKYWPALCRAIGALELERDPRFENILVRSKHAEELVTILDRIFGTKPSDEWALIFSENDLIYGRVQTIPDLVKDPQLSANDYIVDFDHSKWGRVKVVGFPYRFSASPQELGREAPEFGQNTDEVVMELGYTSEDIARLRAEEII